MPTGTATLDFGVFPGASDASVAVTGQAAIVAGSLVEAWIRPVATVDHTADEHMVETLKVFAADIIAATGFTVYGFNTSQILEPLEDRKGLTGTIAGQLSSPQQINQWRTEGGRAPRIYGQWTVAWAWV